MPADDNDVTGRHVLAGVGAGSNGVKRAKRSTGQYLNDLGAKVKTLKVIALAAVSLLALGFMGNAYLGDLATQGDVAAASADVATAVDKIDARVENNRRDIVDMQHVHKSIVKQLDGVERRDLIQSQQLYEIAVRVGARKVPGIKPDAGVP